MADGGASTMILLVSSLLISGVASVVLIESWGEVAIATGINTSAEVADSETQVDFSGDRGDVLLDTSGSNQEITLFFQNTGVRNLDRNEISIFIDGLTATQVGGLTLHPSSGVWAPGSVLEITVSNTNFNYSDGDTATVTIIVSSEVSSGLRGTDSTSAEVRLSV